jgi:predicted DNA binding CopG/RHH family protein
MSTLKQEEKEIFEAFERGELKSVPNKEAELKRHREYAAATFRKDKRINIRISERDLRALQKRALTEGIPYQMLVSSILHKYVEGCFVEKDT